MPEPSAATFGVISIRTLPAHNWSWFLVRGLLMLAFGAISLLSPGLTLVAFTAVFAAFSFVDGVAALVSGLRGAGAHAPRWLSLVLAGLVGMAIGVVFVVWPLFSTAVYAAIVVAGIAGWAIVTGVLQVIAAIRLREAIEGEWLLGLVGLLTVVLGVWLLVQVWNEPLVTLLSVGWLIAFWAIAAGIALIVLALRLRGHGRTSQP
jgi:uncharacterized membrane protein HdeD (DUF308 family)